MEIGDILKDLRRERKLSQEDLAKFLGIDRSTIGKWESNASKPTVDTLYKLADYFNVSMDYLLGQALRKHLSSQGRISALSLVSQSKMSEVMERNFGDKTKLLLNNFSKLNEKGKEKALDYIFDLTEQKKYTEK